MRKIAKAMLETLSCVIPWLRPFIETRDTQNPLSLKMWFYQKVLGINRKAYWPMHFTSKVLGPENIYVGIDASPGYSPGCYIQGIGKVYIGDYAQIGPNVGIISANHDPFDARKHLKWSVEIGKYCLIGMNSVVLPGVKLGNYTFVGAGSVVTKAFPKGYCVLRGNPAVVVKNLDSYKDNFITYGNKHKYHGYIKAEKFELFRKKYLKV